MKQLQTPIIAYDNVRAIVLRVDKSLNKMRPHFFKTLLLACCMILSSNSIIFAQAPSMLWVKGMGGSSTDVGTSIAIDASGNTYTTGQFRGTVDFDPSAAVYNLVSASSNNDDIFVCKFDASGNFVWAKAMGGTAEDRGMGIAVDALGNVYIAGYFNGSADFDPSTSATYFLGSAGNQDIFVTMLDASGNFVWAQKYGGSSSDFGNAIDLDASGNVYITR